MDDPVPEYFKSPNFLEQLEQTEIHNIQSKKATKQIAKKYLPNEYKQKMKSTILFKRKFKHKFKDKKVTNLKTI